LHSKNSLCGRHDLVLSPYLNDAVPTQYRSR
jgi:hypothetical protein